MQRQKVKKNIEKVYQIDIICWIDIYTITFANESEIVNQVWQITAHQFFVVKYFEAKTFEFIFFVHRNNTVSSQ